MKPNNSPHTRNARAVRFQPTTAIQLAFLAVLILFIVVPVVSIFLEIPRGNVFTEGFASSTLSAIRISLITSAAALGLMIVLGIPSARFLSRSQVRGKKVLDTIIDLPIVLPPAVAGLALLLAFAPLSPIGAFLLQYGLILPGNILAVVLAETFVAMPFFVRSAMTAFQEIDPRLEMAASVLSPSSSYSFRRVVLPLASRGLIAGAILGWGRALGEFGATLLFAGNLPGITQTMPLAIYLDLEVNIYQASLVSAILIVISFAIIATVRYGMGSKAV